MVAHSRSQINQAQARERTRTVLARQFEGRLARSSCLGAPAGFSWHTRLLSPLARWPEGFASSTFSVSVLAFRKSDQRMCQLLANTRMSIEQVERSTLSDSQIVDALVSTRVPVLRHVFDRPGFVGSTLRLKVRLVPLSVIGEIDVVRWHFEMLFTFCERADGSDEGEEESCSLDQDSALAILDALRWQ